MKGSISVGGSKIRTTLRFPKEELTYQDNPNSIKTSPCCGSKQIVWWYVGYGADDYGIHVDWSKWEKSYLHFTKFGNESFEYFHEYFHHITDSWMVKHGLRSDELSKEYNTIWRKEESKREGYKSGILMGEALAERFAVRRQDSLEGRSPKDHPSYSLRLTSGGPAYCSIDFVYQVMNKTYEIYKPPIIKGVADRKRIDGLNREYEQYEDEIFSARYGFSMTESVYDKVIDRPNTIPFYVHSVGESENWREDVLEFCKKNKLSKPRFVN